VIVEKRNAQGQGEEATPEDVCELKTYVESNRTLMTPFDIVTVGKTSGLSRSEIQEKLLSRNEVGLTWWIEDVIGESEEQVAERIRQGPPGLD
jgi:hypothetical protein